MRQEAINKTFRQYKSRHDTAQNKPIYRLCIELNSKLQEYRNKFPQKYKNIGDEFCKVSLRITDCFTFGWCAPETQLTEKVFWYRLAMYYCSILKNRLNVAQSHHLVCGNETFIACCNLLVQVTGQLNDLIKSKTNENYAEDISLFPLFKTCLNLILECASSRTFSDVQTSGQGAS